MLELHSVLKKYEFSERNFLLQGLMYVAYEVISLLVIKI